MAAAHSQDGEREPAVPDDIADLVRTEHERIRDLFALPRPEDAHDHDTLRQAWTEVADLLQVHLDAAEEIGCPPRPRASRQHPAAPGGNGGRPRG